MRGGAPPVDLVCIIYYTGRYVNYNLHVQTRKGTPEGVPQIVKTQCILLPAAFCRPQACKPFGFSGGRRVGTDSAQPENVRFSRPV